MKCRYDHHPYFTDEKTEKEKIGYPVNNRAKIPI